MADGRLRAQWGRTAATLAMIANVNRDPKRRRRPYSANDFNPYHTKRKTGTRQLGRELTMDRFATELLDAAKGRPLRKDRKRTRDKARHA